MEKLAKARFSRRRYLKLVRPKFLRRRKTVSPQRVSVITGGEVEAMKASGKPASKFYGTMAGFPIHPCQGELKLAHKISGPSG
jgi:hypothetical protein